MTGVETIRSGHRLPLLDLDSASVYGIVYELGEVVPGCALETAARPRTGSTIGSIRAA